MSKNIYVGLLLAAALSLPVSAETPAAGSLGDVMSTQEIEAMGLDQLSEEQRTLLLQWILRHSGTSTEPETVAPSPSPAAATATATAVAETPAQSAAPVAPKEAQAASATGAATPPAAASTYDDFGKPQPTPDEMRSRIAGNFEGWTGTTRFELENGQVWQQRYKTSWHTSLDNPEVIITRHFLGLHRMEVVGTGQSVPVKRVK